MPKLTKATALARLAVKRDRTNGSTDILLDGKRIGTVVTKGSSDPRFKVGGNVSSKTITVMHGAIEGVSFREEAASGRAALAKVAAVVAKAVNANGVYAKPAVVPVPEDDAPEANGPSL